MILINSPINNVAGVPVFPLPHEGQVFQTADCISYWVSEYLHHKQNSYIIRFINLKQKTNHKMKCHCDTSLEYLLPLNRTDCNLTLL